MELALLDTTFLVDLERETKSGQNGRARPFLEKRADLRLFISFTVAGELACGASLAQIEAWRKFIAPFQVVHSDPEICWQYGTFYQSLKHAGSMIGANDLWIAATAKANGMTVVTRNLDEFRRIPDGPDITDY